MGTVFYMIFLILGAIIMIALTISVIKRTKAIPKNIENIERILSQSGFMVSRKIGDYNKMWGVHRYFLYVDDVNKKWLITSPLSSEVGKIRTFDDLIDYEFFDEDGGDVFGKIGRGVAGVAGALGGLAVGGLAGGIIGGVGSNKASKILPGMQGESFAYGFAIQTKDCDVNNPLLIIDFFGVSRQRIYDSNNIGDKVFGTFGKVTKAGISRGAQSYKRDIAVIQEMAGVFDYIINSNVQT